MVSLGVAPGLQRRERIFFLVYAFPRYVFHDLQLDSFAFLDICIAVIERYFHLYFMRLRFVFDKYVRDIERICRYQCYFTGDTAESV